MSFVHLHTHSHYSLLDGLPKIDELIAKAKECKMPALALTDHGVMYGSVEFFQKATEAGLKPIVGQEVYMARHGLNMKRPRLDGNPYHLILLAKNKTGYQNLIKITTKAHLEGFYYKPRIDFEFLKDHAEGLICSTACIQGEVPSKIINDEISEAEKIIEQYKKLFGADSFYLEIQNNPSVPGQQKVNETMRELAQKHKIGLVATNDIHYLNSDDSRAQDILLCIQTKKHLSDTDRMTMTDDFSFIAPEKMKQDFSDYPGAIENTLKIAEMCDFEMDLGKIKLPHFVLPEDKTADDYLRELCLQGFKKRYGDQPMTSEMKERLEYELSIIEKTGFASYFLIVQDFVNWSKEQNIIVGPGRGSAAGSFVSYLTNITNIDPIKHDLIFERFLNPERISMPDIDLDFADSRRDEVIRYVEEKYGKDRVAQIITFGTMAARAAVRDVGRVMGLSYSYCDRMAKMIPMFSSLDQALEANPELKEAYDKEADAKHLLDEAKKLEGVARHSSTHACGVVITKEPLDYHVPRQFASQDDKTIITQYSLHPIEDLGLLKMDFLGLKNLTVIENAIYIIEKTAGVKMSIDDIPLDDKKTYQLFQKGQTTGVFQYESSGMKRYLQQLKPTIFEDLISMVALYRPGPMDSIPKFIQGKHHPDTATYLHPNLEPILKKTYGVIVTQEQVLQIARDLAGFSLGEADVLRKAVGKKIPKLLAEQRAKFIKGSVANGLSKSIAEQIFDLIEPFSGYGFNRAHAACYALIGYQTAYLKANYPAQFMAALMTSDQDNTDRIAIEVSESEKIGIKILPPDVNESFSTFTVVKESVEKNEPRIRFGMKAIKNVGANIVDTIIQERKTNSAYKNLEDFLTRVQTKDLNKKSLESLTKSGALDIFGDRNEIIHNMEQLLRYSKACQKASANGQTNLFCILPTENAPQLKLHSTEPATKSQKLSWEKELLGLYITEHPLDDYKDQLFRLATPCLQLNQYRNQEAKVAGVLTKIQKKITRNNENMLFAQLEDTSGNVEVLVFPKILRDNPDIWQEDKVIIVTGKVSDKDGVPKLICNKVTALDINNLKKYSQKASSPARIVNVNVPHNTRKSALFKLKEIFAKHPGNNKVHLTIHNQGQTRRIATNAAVNYDSHLVSEVEQIIGQNNINLLQ